MDVYAMLGVRSVINAHDHLTALGGGLMPPVVLAAMQAAAQSPVDLVELKEKAGAHLARLTRNEAATICNGAAAGLVQAVAGCVTGTDPWLVEALPQGLAPHRRVIIQCAQRNGFDLAIHQVGVEVAVIGFAENTAPYHLEAALTEDSAAVLWFADSRMQKGSLTLSELVRISHAHGVPVIVDAAAQLPPVSNLWHYTREMGADLAIFSGGKGLRGPQNAGLIVGCADLVQAAAANGSPHASIGRPMKVGKEEIAGLVAAVEWALGPEGAAFYAGLEARVHSFIGSWQVVPGVELSRIVPGPAGQSYPRVGIRFGQDAPRSREQVVVALRACEPQVEVGILGADGIFLNPISLRDGEMEKVSELLQAVLAGDRGVTGTRATT